MTPAITMPKWLSRETRVQRPNSNVYYRSEFRATIKLRRLS